MVSKVEFRDSDNVGNSNNGQLLHEIEAISKALYLDQTPRKALFPSSSGVRSKSVERPRLLESKSSVDLLVRNGTFLSKDKKTSSMWNWKKPFKALSHIGRQKLNICFILHVHSIEGLPPSFNDLTISVNFKRKGEVMRTSPSRVVNGNVEFDETLMHTCCVYGSRNGQNLANYEVKLSLIYASIVGASGIDLGKHLVDLTRMLPLTLEELAGEKSTGKWTTSFKLAGKAKTANLNVSFGFSLIKRNLVGPTNDPSVSDIVELPHNRSGAVTLGEGCGKNNNIGRIGSVPSNLDHGLPQSSHAVDEVSQHLGFELSKSINFLYQKFDEMNLCNSEVLEILSEREESVKPKSIKGFEVYENPDEDYDNMDFTVIEQGIEITEQQLESEGFLNGAEDATIDTMNLNESIMDSNTSFDLGITSGSVENTFPKYKVIVNNCEQEQILVYKEQVNGEDVKLSDNWFIREIAELESQQAISEFLQQENRMETKSDHKDKLVNRSLSLDRITETVAIEFLNMLGIEHTPFGHGSQIYPESPRECLLREFEKEALASGSFVLDYNGNAESEVDQAGPSCRDPADTFDFPSVIQTAREDHHGLCPLHARRKMAKLLEDLEAEALMRKWGLDEKAFQSSPRCSDGFGSPIELPHDGQSELPQLGDGFGYLVKTKDGGYLRSMKPFLFKNLKNCGNLVMQVSRPVVVPAEMGSEIMSILQHLSSIGVESLCLQANKLMPLEDLTGKTLQEIARDASLGAEDPGSQFRVTLESLLKQNTSSGRKVSLPPNNKFFNNSSLNGTDIGSDYTTLKELSPLAMDKIEAMLIEGLKIQYGTSVEAQSSISALGKNSASLGWSLNSEGGVKWQDNDFDELLNLSISLDEWSRLDAGVISDEDYMNEYILRILAVHHAKSMDPISGTFRKDKHKDKAYVMENGLLGDHITIALRILLRDPLRNYEPVGASMLALIQVERILHSAMRLHNTTSLSGNNENEDSDWMGLKTLSNYAEENEVVHLFEITGVHLSGLNTEDSKNHLWGGKLQQQSGIRWLVTNGMSKSYKHPISKSKAIVVSNSQLMSKGKTYDTLWSISSHTNGRGTNMKHLVGFSPYIRNPDIVFTK
ncbi:hypothetical protein K2173_015731 [Erythroxylum novogranatense]|uniref:C2 NT-type domain-containing protein n=1 Tax=Erythroxylum novogranatense TaxID=1862640 RepID=A0AAV8SF68_9ROSI|nr:hypothetical protein K2173_015731 [Erythroxylum novogranatense]